MEMTCPKCHAQMRQYERSGVIVDQCIECRGIFLDRGELDRLVDGEASWHGGSAQRQPAHPGGAPQQHRYRDYDSDEYPIYGQAGHGQSHGHGKRKHRGFLEELFD
jgi:uncharacterized protein